MKNKEHIEIQQEVYYPTGNMLTKPNGLQRPLLGTGNTQGNLRNRLGQVASILRGRENGNRRINPLGASIEKPVFAQNNMSKEVARGEANSAAARHGLMVKPNDRIGEKSVKINPNHNITAKGSSQQRRGVLATNSIELNKYKNITNEQQITEGGFSRLARLTAAMGKKTLQNTARTEQGATIDNAFQTKSGSTRAAITNANNKPGLNAALNQSQMKNVISSGGMKHPDSGNKTTNFLRNGAAIGDPHNSSSGIRDALGGPLRQVVSAGGAPGHGSNYGPNAGVTGYSGSAASNQRYKLSLQKEKAAAALASSQKIEQQEYIADFITNMLNENKKRKH